ncbi:GNAT family N-acetyltransferase [Vibrio sp. SM6]|uniref:GNAT family N-acetyltransferase n=1 Tax=Vibrio agarilyticus TaxID=2726741 RepID=A0A7X8YFZ7_9VIBR|nr:GNAT family protein [Vibrio agarilyticus]NLS11876.1 GNAT family N-acetyltransferase [Vibrio agarilyticus]
MTQPIGYAVANWQAPPFPTHEILTGHFCRLEPLNVAKHSQTLFAANALNQDDTLWTYLPYGPFATLSDYQSWLALSEQSQDPQFYAVVDNASGEAIGVISYLRITPEAGTIEIGHLCFSPRLQKTPAATETVYLLMAKAFELGYRRCEWKCDALNQPSRHAALRYGFTFEGIFRQAGVYKGRNRDTAWFAVLDNEWPILQPGFQMWLASSNFDSHGQQKQRLNQCFAVQSHP